MGKLKIKKDDQVIVLSGSNKGTTGVVKKIFPETRKAIVADVNMVKKHVKPNAEKPQGGIQEKEAPIHISKLALVEDGKPTKVGYQTKDGKKVRVSKRSGKEI